MPQLFKNLEIRNYRAFDHLVLKELGQVNLFIGKNNIGKSSLLEALWLYANLGAPHIIHEILTERDDLVSHRSLNENSTTLSPDQGVSNIAQEVLNLFNGYPKIDLIEKKIEIGMINSPDSALCMTVEWYGIDRTKTKRSTLIPVDDKTRDYDGDIIPALVVKQGTYKKTFRLDVSLTDHAKRWRLQPKNYIDLLLPASFIGPHGIRQSDLPRMWKRIVLTELKQDIVESLRIIHPSIDDVAVINSEDPKNISVQVRIEKQAETVPLKSLGDGMNRLFGLTLGLVNAQNGMLLIDEVENGLHYSIMPLVWKFILKVAKRLNVQVFATTHSMDCIKAFHIATKDDSDIEGITTRIEFKNGELRISQFDENRLSTIIEEDIEIR